MNEEHQTMIEDCEKRSEKLTDWERDFIDSLSRRERPLMAKQADTLEQIWDRVAL